MSTTSTLVEAEEDRSRHDKDRLVDDIRSLYQQTPASIVGNIVGMAILTTLFWGLAPPRVLASWLLPFAALLATRWVL